MNFVPFFFALEPTVWHVVTTVVNKSGVLYICRFAREVLTSQQLRMIPGISYWALHGSYYFLVGSGCSLLLAGGLWMLAVTCWWALEWLLLFFGGLCMVPGIS